MSKYVIDDGSESKKFNGKTVRKDRHSFKHMNDVLEIDRSKIYNYCDGSYNVCSTVIDDIFSININDLYKNVNTHQMWENLQQSLDQFCVNKSKKFVKNTRSTKYIYNIPINNCVQIDKSSNININSDKISTAIINGEIYDTNLLYDNYGFNGTYVPVGPLYISRPVFDNKHIEKLTHVGVAGEKPLIESMANNDKKPKCIYKISSRDYSFVETFEIYYKDINTKKWIFLDIFDGNTDVFNETIINLNKYFNTDNGIFTKQLKFIPVEFLNKPIMRIAIYGVNVNNNQKTVKYTIIKQPDELYMLDGTCVSNDKSKKQKVSHDTNIDMKSITDNYEMDTYDENAPIDNLEKEYSYEKQHLLWDYISTDANMSTIKSEISLEFTENPQIENQINKDNDSTEWEIVVKEESMTLFEYIKYMIGY
jgi:plasmid maintenance system antidote protein VapI